MTPKKTVAREKTDKLLDAKLRHWDAVLCCANETMYAAKQAGCKRVMIYSRNSSGGA